MKSLRKLGKRKKMEPQLEVYEDQVLGEGSFGAVFKGKFGERDVAVKRVMKKQRLFTNVENKREEQALKLLAHENVMMLYDVKDEKLYRDYILELCQASLDQLYLPDNHPRKYKGRKPTDLNILLQFSRGLEHVHKYLIHRDIKPENVLLADDDGFVRVKVGDFGLSKPVSINGSCEMSGIKGTPVWMAPELLLIIEKYQEDCASENPEKIKDFEAFLYEQHASTKSDVFSAGCVFFYVVTQGKHPFGWTIFAQENVKKGNPVFFSSLDPEHFAVGIIRKMIALDPKERMSMAEVTADLTKLQKQVSDS